MSHRSQEDRSKSVGRGREATSREHERRNRTLVETRVYPGVTVSRCDEERLPASRIKIYGREESNRTECLRLNRLRERGSRGQGNLVTGTKGRPVLTRLPSERRVRKGWRLRCYSSTRCTSGRDHERRLTLSPKSSTGYLFRERFLRLRRGFLVTVKIWCIYESINRFTGSHILGPSVPSLRSGT